MPRYDYTTPGAYFITVVIHQRRCLLADVLDHESVPTSAGAMVREIWEALPKHYSGVEIDVSVVMPDHLHGILRISRPASASPTILALPDVLQRFKTLTTTRCMEGVERHGWPRFDRHLWQRSFHDRVIRDEAQLVAYREYIEHNPRRWARDRTFP